MKVDGTIALDPAHAAQSARAAEAAGYDGAWCPETNHDPFVSLTLASEHTERLQLGTAIAVAFARNPMSLATTANDLQLLSQGRLMLGLGSQIQPHIEKRFSMPWSHPAPRMREFIAAMRAIWGSWNDGERLAFRGDFYTHTLMTPFFNPGPNPHGPPKVYLAGVGPKMTEVAGEMSDGFLCHGFTTERYLNEVTIPALIRGRAKVGKTLDGFDVAGPFFVITGTNDDEVKAADSMVRSQIAFYGSTPAYRAVLELHGWGELQTELNSLSKQGRWSDMAEMIDDDIVDAFAVVAEPDRVAPELLERFGGTVTRLSFYMPGTADAAKWSGIVATLQAA
ncbi:MAG: TIGR03617 family F420-dependent LLM class oxidoreductase [Acidimicrobiales bacterium]